MGRQKHPSRRHLPSSRLLMLRHWRNTKRQQVMLVATTKTRRVPRSSEDAEVEAEASNRQRPSCSHCFYCTWAAKDLQSTGRLYTSFLGRRRLLRLCLAKLRIRFCSLETGAEQCEARCRFLRRIGADGRRRLATHLSRWHCAIGITAK